MTEKDFWLFLRNEWAKGRPRQISGTIDSDNEDFNNVGAFIGGHSLLPKNCDKIPISKIEEIGSLLNDGSASINTKQAILILLAHHPSRQALNALRNYSKNPDEKLKIFAELALDECIMWNE